MIRSKATIIAMKSGNNGLITLVMVVFATPTPINSMEPTGGVHRPILRFRIIMIPKCIGSIPSSITIGKKIGIKALRDVAMIVKPDTILTWYRKLIATKFDS